MKIRLPGRLNRSHRPACPCAHLAGTGAQDCACHEMCATREWIPAGPTPEQPPGLTLQSLGPGAKARIESLSVPEALKRRLWSLGLTCGTEIAVVNKEGGRMIIAVRDSRLGLGPETASRILCRPA